MSFSLNSISIFVKPLCIFVWCPIQDDESTIQSTDETYHQTKDKPSDNILETEPEQGKVFDRNLKLKNKNSISKEQTKDLRQYVTIQSVDEEVLEDTDEISQSTTSAKVGNTLYIIFKYISNIYLNCFSLDFANSTNMYKKVMRVITLID